MYRSGKLPALCCCVEFRAEETTPRREHPKVYLASNQHGEWRAVVNPIAGKRARDGRARVSGWVHTHA